MNLPPAHALIGRIPLVWRTLGAILILLGALGLIIQGRASILRSGKEVRLRTVPVDPRDLFRGDYVVLNYTISTVDAPQGERRLERGEKVYVVLGPGGDGFAEARRATTDWPSTSGDEVVMAGRVTSPNACVVNAEGVTDCRAGRGRLRVAYGLESYFVPQGTGRAIETTDRKRLEIVAAVSGSGEAAIKRLLIDGKLVHAEPPY